MNYTLTKFSTSHCGQCKALEQLLIKSEISFTNVDAEISEEYANSLGIRNVPTCIIFDENNNEVERFTGIRPAKELMELKDKYNL